MTRPNIHAVIVLIACAGLVGLFTEPQWRPALAAWLMPEVPTMTLQDAMQCPPYREGKSRTLVIFADEGEDGKVANVRCVRMAARGRL
jgi:hypothetical protein